MKQVLFRADASYEIGFGHLSRCFTLANHFQNKGWKCFFAIDKITLESISIFKENIINYFLVERKKFSDIKKIIMDEKFDIIVIDHYEINSAYEEKCANYVSKVVVIDDVANRKHFCDFLIDQNLGREVADYKNYVPSKCKLLLGSSYFLLREDFLKKRYRKKNKNYESQLKIFVCFGASDFHDITSKVILICDQLKFKFQLIIVMSSMSPNLTKIKSIALKNPKNIKLYIDTQNVKELMESSDFAIGACGVTAWERCYLGLPSICIITAPNQNFIYDNLLKKGLIIGAGAWNNLSKNDLLNQIILLSLDLKLRNNISSNCKNLIDGLGPSRVFFALTGT